MNQAESLFLASFLMYATRHNSCWTIFWWGWCHACPKGSRKRKKCNFWKLHYAYIAMYCHLPSRRILQKDFKSYICNFWCSKSCQTTHDHTSHTSTWFCTWFTFLVHFELSIGVVVRRLSEAVIKVIISQNSKTKTIT